MIVSILLSCVGCNNKDKEDDNDSKKNDSNSTAYNIGYKDGETYFITYEGQLKTIDKKLTSNINFNRIICYKDDETALIDSNGNIVVEYGKYSEITYIESGSKIPFFAVTNEDDKVGLIDTDGEEVIECKYKRVNPMISGDLLYGFYAEDDNGEFIVYNYNAKMLLEIKSKSFTWRYSGESFGDEGMVLVIYYKVNNEKIAKAYNIDTGVLLTEYNADNEYDGGFVYNVLTGPGSAKVYDKNGKVVLTVDNEYLKEQFGEIKEITAYPDIMKYNDILKVHFYTGVHYNLVYDSDFNLIYKNKKRTDFFSNNDGDPMYLTSDDDGNNVVYDIKGNEILKSKYTIDNATNNGTYGFTVKDLSDKYQLNLYDKKGKLIAKDISTFSNGYNDNEKNKVVFVGESLAQTYEADDGYRFTKSLLDNYILITNGKKYQVVDLEKGKVTYEFDASEKYTTLSTVKAIIVGDKYYTYDGEKICDKIN